MPVDVARALQIRAAIGRMRDSEEIAAPGDDRLVDRHGAELFGSVAAPDATPPDARYVAPRMTLVEWIGQTSPLQSDVVVALKARGLLTPFHRLVLEQAALMTIFRADGMTSRTLGPRDGLSRTIRWGHLPGTYVQEISMRDAETIFASPAAEEFRLVGRDAATSERTPDEAWRTVLRALRDVSAARGQALPPSESDAARIRLRVSAEEKLSGVGNGGGYWTAAN